MAEQVRVVVDAMGGDNAPVEPVKASSGSCDRETGHKSNTYRKAGSN